MKRFFGTMNFPRAVILFCCLGSLVLGVLVFLRSQRLRAVKSELVQVEQLLRQMHVDAHKLASLQDNASSDKFKAQSEPEFHIRTVAQEIGIGQVDVANRTGNEVHGIEDRIYGIKPQSKTQYKTRTHIGNFLYKLEKESHRVKVTRIKLTPSERLVPGQIGKDEWMFEADLTIRTKVESASAPAAQQQG